MSPKKTKEFTPKSFVINSVLLKWPVLKAKAKQPVYILKSGIFIKKMNVRHAAIKQLIKGGRKPKSWHPGRPKAIHNNMTLS